MCVGFWSLEHPDYALILCTNRDEFITRPTMPAHFHSFGHEAANEANILSGIDLRAGGTWLGINRSGRLALLTNITGPPSDKDSSRGYLTSTYLLSDPAVSFDDELGRLNRLDAKFAGFNLLLLSPLFRDSQSLSFDAALVTNHGAGGVLCSRPLSADERLVGGIANGVDGQGGNQWPKIQQGVKYLKDYLGTLPSNTKEAELTDHLFDLLTWRPAEPAREAKDTIHIDPSPVDSHSDIHATRLSTVILIKRDGQVLFIERDMWQLNEDGNLVKADPSSQRVFRFQLAFPALRPDQA